MFCHICGKNEIARACSHSSPEVIDVLLNHGADLNKRDSWGSLPIYGAMSRPEVRDHLIQRGAQLDLKAPIDMQQFDLAEQLVLEDPTRVRLRFGTGVTLLHDASRTGNLVAVQLLLRHGTDVDAVTNWDATALHLACFNGHADVAATLLEHGADVDARDNAARTPLALAEARGHKNCTELLINRGGAPGHIS